MENIDITTEPTQAGTPPWEPAQSTSSPRESVQQEAARAADKAGEVKDAATREATAAYEQAKSGAADFARQASDYIQQATRTQKGVLAGKVDEYRDAARAASEKLQSEQHGPVAERVDKIATHLDRLSGYLRETEPADLLEDAESFARRRPEVVLGTMFIAGLAAARFLKASKRRVPRRSEVPAYLSTVPRPPYSPSGVGYTPEATTVHPTATPVYTPVAAEPLTGSPGSSINPGTTI